MNLQLDRVDHVIKAWRAVVETLYYSSLARHLKCRHPTMNPEQAGRYHLARRATARQETTRGKTSLDRARDELFSAIRQCGVIDASPDDQAEWMAETVKFMAQRHPQLTGPELAELESTGLRFCQPVIPHGSQPTPADLEDANAA